MSPAHPPWRWRYLVLGVVLAAPVPAAAEDTSSLSAAVPPAEVPSAVHSAEVPAPSADVQALTARILAATDNAGFPFVIVDKRNAAVFAFTPTGASLGTAPALLGLARGDTNPPGIGEKPLSAVRPDERITPAGRYVAALGRDLKEDILWIDYASGLSMHRVIRGKPADKRLVRLTTPTPDDNRISYGCINVPVAFFESVILPAFSATGIVYILPETRPLAEVFALSAPLAASAEVSGQGGSLQTANNNPQEITNPN